MDIKSAEKFMEKLVKHMDHKFIAGERSANENIGPYYNPQMSELLRKVPEIIEEFRFYTPHITRFYNRDGQIVKEYPRAQLLTLCLDQIQPSQFFVDEDKIAAISSFIHKPQDIIIQVLPSEDRFISLDGHTRLYYAVMKGWECIRAVVESSDDWVYKFVTEAQKRGIYTPKEMALVSHDEYEEKWNRFCDDFFAGDGVE